RLAQQEMERLRDFSIVVAPAAAASDVRSYTQIGADGEQRSNAGNANSNASFALQWRALDADEAPLAGVQVDAPPQHKRVRVQVSWTDRAGDSNQVTLDSVIARVDPALAGSLGQAPDATPTRRPAERNAAIPLSAKDLGNKTSVFVPGPTATVAWVFNNLSGVIVGRCTVPMGTSSGALTSADVEACSGNTIGYLLSGFVRFSYTSPPDPDQPSGPALPGIDLGLVQAPAPPATPAQPSPARPALPDSQCFDDAPSSARTSLSFVSYNCIVYPNASSEGTASWSGRLELSGLALGDGGWTVCRYSADYDGDEHIANAEHPLNYYDVTRPLARQNFLVIAATSSCPAGHAVDVSAGLFSNTATVRHQPGGI
ncbi:MAG: hypothetical protein ABW005_16090, partial [Burkholderiaceae bacterium]